MVQIEALSCGTPVIATDLPGVRQPVQSTGMGKIVLPRDPDVLGRAIIEMLDSGIQVDPKGVEMVIQHYAPETVAKAYEGLYRDLVRDDE